jgi:hypothetical protein
MPFGYFWGSIANVYFHPGQSDYYNILNPKRGFPGCAQINLDGKFGPSDLGKDCTGPFGPVSGPSDYLPILCLVGGIDKFKYNHGGATSLKLSPNSHIDIQVPPATVGDPWGLFEK